MKYIQMIKLQGNIQLARKIQITKNMDGILSIAIEMRSIQNQKSGFSVMQEPIQTTKNDRNTKFIKTVRLRLHNCEYTYTGCVFI
jgi:hypothetical protein